MALQNPPNLYSGGQGVFDSRPVLMFQANLMAKKKAKEDALEAYYGKSLQDVTPAGMRNKDIVGGWSQQLEEFKNFGMNPENKKYLLNPSLDGHKTVTEFNRRHTKLLSDAELSKQALKQEVDIYDLKKSGKLDPDNDDIVLFDRIGKSIYDETRNDEFGNAPDMSNMSYFVPEFDNARQAKADKLIFGNIKGGKTYDEKNAINDNKTGQVIMPYVETYSTENIEQIGNNAERAVSSDKSMRKAYNDLLHNDPELVAKATGFLQGVEGKNAVVDTPAKLAKADYMMKAASYAKRGEEVKTDWKYQMEKRYDNQVNFEDNHKFPHQVALANIYSKIRRADSEYKQNEAYSNLENYRLNQIKNGSKLPSMFGNLGIDTDNTIKLNVSPTDLENFDVETPVVDEDGKPKTDKNGKPLFTKSKAKDIFYNMKTEEYTPVVDGYMGNKFKKDGWLVSYVNGAANTTPKINMLSGGGVKSGGTKEGKKSSASSSKSDRPNLPKSKTKISW